MYIITDGEVSVLRNRDDGEMFEVDRMHGNVYFGEAALFVDHVLRISITIRVEREARLLILHKREFNEIVREYPQIALHICKKLSHRLRKAWDMN